MGGPSIVLDLPYIDSIMAAPWDAEDSMQEHPLALEFALKQRKFVHTSEMYCSLESFKFKVKELRITKAERRKEKFLQNNASATHVVKNKTCYTVFEDMVILTTFVDEKFSEKSMNDKIDRVMEDLPERSFESLRERYRKWLKDFDETEIDKIVRFCDENYETCSQYMIKRRLDAQLGRHVVDQFIKVPKKGGTEDRAETRIDEELPPAFKDASLSSVKRLEQESGTSSTHKTVEIRVDGSVFSASHQVGG